MKLRLSYLIILLTSLATASGKNMIIREYTTENGLLHNTVYSVMKDADGFVWLGTWYGLTSFDAVKFKPYNTRGDYNTDIPPHKLQNLFEAPDGNLWVKTIDHKLFLFEKKNELFVDVFNVIRKKYPVSSKIIKIQPSDSGSLLMLTKNKDLLQGQSTGNGQIEVDLLYDSKSTRENKLTNNLLVENQHSINWIGIDYKVISIAKGKTLQSKPADYLLQQLGMKNRLAYSAAHSNRSTLWLGTREGVLYTVDVQQGNVKRWDQFNGQGSIDNILTPADQVVYISIRHKGIFALNLKTGEFTLVVSITGNQTVTNSCTDSYDKLWFILNERDIVYYDPFNRIQRIFNLAEGKVNRTIKFQDGKEEGMFFLTTAGEMITIDRNELSLNSLSKHPDLNNRDERPLFLDFLFDNDNILWLTSTTRGVFRINFPKAQFDLRQISSGTGKSVADAALKALYQSRNGDIWVGSRNGEVMQLDKNGRLIRVFSQATYSIGTVYHIMEDHLGRLWFSTKGNGLVRADRDASSPLGFRFTRYLYSENDPGSLSSNDVYYTLEDSRKRIWVALFGGGLNLLTEENGKPYFRNKYNSFRNYPQLGLYMEVRNLAEDKNGRIWVGTSDGLMSFDGNFQQPDRINFEVYRNDGDKINVFDNDVYVLYKDAGGRIWMSVFGGGLYKLLSYDPQKKQPVIQSYGVNQGLKSDVILSITEDQNNQLWLATENTITRFDVENESFRNFDRYDGLQPVQMEEESALQLQSGELWFGNRKGILSFDPQSISTYQSEYKTFIVDFWVSNRDLKSFGEEPILRSSIRYAREIKLKHNQSSFAIEFAALNFYNPNRVSYKYILEGYEDEWHFNSRNRIASYPNVPPGEYTFKVVAIDEANAGLESSNSLTIIVLPPWWLTWWAKSIYLILFLVALYFIIRASYLYIRMRNEMYVEQRVSELKIRFFTNISHELRTPLTLIMGPIQELRQKQQLTEKGQQYVSMIEKNARQMLQLVNQILDFRKIQNGKMVLHVSHTDINELVKNLHTEFSVMSEENEISFLHQTIDESPDLWIDKEKMETVIRNLLSNAFKFTKSGGSIYLSCGITTDGKHCFIRVEDTGVGIPQNKIMEIFERFFQDENALSAQYPGTGIGLALAKEIVTLHHGTIHAESSKDKGSVFTVELQLGRSHFADGEVNFYITDTPAETAVHTEQETPEEETFTGREALPTLLVVEDNKDLRDLLHLQLDGQFNIFTAANGVEGLRKVNLYQPDIIITDQMMPEMTGTEMIQAIRTDFQISHIPIIMLTAKTDDESKIQAIHMGANVYITKPFNIDYLVACIEQLLSDRKVFREKIWKQEQPAGTPNESYEKYLQEKDFQFLEKIHQVIEENLDNSDFNIDSIADTLGISRSAFFKKLKSLTGLAPVDMIKDYRLQKSLDLLQTTDLSVSEIAFEVGFREAGYFGKCFRKKYGQTPTEYMSLYRKKQ